MDTIRGRYRALPVAGAHLLQVVNQCGEVGAVNDYYAKIYPHLPISDIRTLSDHRLRQLINQGAIGFGPKKERRDFIEATPENAIRFDDTPASQAAEKSPSLLDTLFVAKDIVRAIHLTNRPFPDVDRRIRRSQEKAQRPATFEEAQRIGAVVVHLGRQYPGRFACLESTVATVLSGSSQGVRIDMQFGVALNPTIYHVWPEAEGQPVPLKPSLTSQRFYPVYRIGGDRPDSSS